MDWKCLTAAFLGSCVACSVVFVYAYHAGMKKGAEITRQVWAKGLAEMTTYSCYCIGLMRQRMEGLERDRDDRGPAVN